MTCKKCPYCGIYNRCLSCNNGICEGCGADLDAEGRAINKALSDVTSFPNLYPEMDGEIEGS